MRLATVPTPDGFEARPVGLDGTAVMMMATAAGVDTRMLAAIFPRIEAAILNPVLSDEQEEVPDDDA